MPFTHLSPDLHVERKTLDFQNMKDFRRASLSSINENNHLLENESEMCPEIVITPCEEAPPLNEILSNNTLEIETSQNDDSSNGNSLSRNSSNSDLTKLKLTATRLQLGTRRSSYDEWKEKYIYKTRRRSKPDLSVNMDENGNDVLTQDRKERINSALQWLKTELSEMRSQDQELARTLLSIRQDIHQLKLRRSCQQHQDMLEEVKCDMEEIQEIQNICDIPIESVNNNPLKQLGVTPMNLSTRRFSIF